MSNHSPGPWSISGQLIVSPPLEVPNPKVEPHPKVIASVAWDWDGDRGATERRTKWPEAEANLRLMSAAPDLLAALEAFVVPWSAGGRWEMKITYETYNAARAAIAKAKGENHA